MDEKKNMRNTMFSAAAVALCPLCRPLSALSLSLSLSVDVTALYSTEPRHKAQKLLVLTLAGRHLERSWDVIITAGGIRDNDSGHLLYRSTSKPLQGPGRVSQT